MQSLLAEMAAKGIHPAPREPAVLGVPPTPDAAPEMPLAAVPVIPRPAYSAPEEAELEGQAAAASRQQAVQDAQLASAEERDKGNELFKRKQWELVCSKQCPNCQQHSLVICMFCLHGIVFMCHTTNHHLLPTLPALQSLRHYERASQLYPGCKLALANQAAALLKLRRWGDAAQAATKVRVYMAALRECCLPCVQGTCMQVVRAC